MKEVFAAWIKIDETLPWIELQGKYKTKKEAKKAAKEILHHTQIMIVEMLGKKRQVKALAIKH